MIENEKVIIYTGPTKAFNEFTMKFYEKDKNNYNLTKLVNLSESERNTLLVKILGQEQKKDSNFEENVIDLLTVSSNEYSGVTEAVTSNFVNYISKYNISKLIIQNPPIEIINDLKKQFDEKDICEYNYDYGKINNKLIVNFKKDCNSIILGQEEALEKVIQSLIIQQKLFVAVEQSLDVIKAAKTILFSIAVTCSTVFVFSFRNCRINVLLVNVSNRMSHRTITHVPSDWVAVEVEPFTWNDLIKITTKVLNTNDTMTKHLFMTWLPSSPYTEVL